MALRTDGERRMKPELSGSATNLWKTAASKDEDPAALTHQGKPYCTVTAKASAQAKANEWSIPTTARSTGKLPRHRICRRKLHQVPYGHYNSNVRNHLYGVDENLDSIMLAGFGSLLTKILFSYRSTEVYGILIVMKIPTERSRSWGLRSNPWLLIGEVREVCICLHSHFESMHFGALRWLHSTHPYGKIEYDFRFDMIDVVPFEMIYD